MFKLFLKNHDGLHKEEGESFKNFLNVTDKKAIEFIGHENCSLSLRLHCEEWLRVRGKYHLKMESFGSE